MSVCFHWSTEGGLLFLTADELLCGESLEICSCVWKSTVSQRDRDHIFLFSNSTAKMKPPSLALFLTWEQRAPSSRTDERAIDVYIEQNNKITEYTHLITTYLIQEDYIYIHLWRMGFTIGLAFTQPMEKELLWKALACWSGATKGSVSCPRMLWHVEWEIELSTQRLVEDLLYLLSHNYLNTTLWITGLTSKTAQNNLTSRAIRFVFCIGAFNHIAVTEVVMTSWSFYFPLLLSILKSFFVHVGFTV